MLVAVTGAHGTIGRALVEELTSTGHRVRAIDRTAAQRSTAESITADARDYHQLREAIDGADALIHLAGIPSPLHEPGHTVHNTNVTASYNALAAATETGITHICLASSINAIGGAFSRRARYDYFPIDENHPTHNEDPYGLSKWIAEQQADSFARAHPQATITTLRIHGATPDRRTAAANIPRLDDPLIVNHLWGYVRLDALAQALRLTLHAGWHGHETLNIAAPDTAVDTPSEQLAHQYYPHVPLRRPLPANSSFYDCSKAHHLLGWTHPRP